MLIFLLQYWSFFKFISKNKLFSLNIISGSIMAAHARIFNTISCTWSMIIPRNIFYIFFLLSTIYSCPRRCAYTILETFLCTYVHTVWHSILTVFMVAAVRTRSDFSNRLKTMATDLRCFYYWSLTVFLNSWFTVLKLCTQYLVYSHTFNINVRRKCRTLITSCIALFVY